MLFLTFSGVLSAQKLSVSGNRFQFSGTYEMFSPIAMVFGMDHPDYKEPWNYGADALRKFKRYDSLRYRLLPYIYSNAYQLDKIGAPLMWALVLDYQDDENVYEIGDQYCLENI